MKLQLKLLMLIFLVVGVFSVSQNYIYGQTYQQQQTGEEEEEGEEKKVELLSHKVERRSGENSSKFIGQVQNMLDKNVEYVTVISTFYDEKGEIIGSKSIYTKPNNIKPNMTASFEMNLSDEISSTNYNNITSYDVTITWRLPGESERHSNVYG